METVVLILILVVNIVLGLATYARLHDITAATTAIGIILEEHIDDNCGVEFIPEEKLELH